MPVELKEFLQRIMKAIRRLQRLRKRATREAVYTVKEAVDRLGWSAWYIRKLCKEGAIAATKVPGEGGGKGGWRITDEEVERIRAAGKRKPQK